MGGTRIAGHRALERRAQAVELRRIRVVVGGRGIHLREQGRLRGGDRRRTGDQRDHEHAAADDRPHRPRHAPGVCRSIEERPVSRAGRAWAWGPFEAPCRSRSAPGFPGRDERGGHGPSAPHATGRPAAHRPHPSGTQGEVDQTSDVGPAQGRGSQAVAREHVAGVGVVEADVVAQVVAVALEPEVQASLDPRGVAERAGGRLDEREAACAQPLGNHAEHGLLPRSIGHHEVEGPSRAFGTPGEGEHAPRHVAQGHDVEARAARGGDAQGQGGARRGVGQGGGHADELKEEMRGRAARRVRRAPHHGARPEDPHVETVAPPGGAQRRLGLELDAFVGVVELLTDVAFALQHRPRAPATDVCGRELGPGREAPACQGFEEAHRALDVAGAEALGILGEEDALARAVDHRLHGGVEAGAVSDDRGRRRFAEIALDDLEIGRRRARRARRRRARVAVSPSRARAKTVTGAPPARRRRATARPMKPVAPVTRMRPTAAPLTAARPAARTMAMGSRVVGRRARASGWRSAGYPGEACAGGAATR